jgi:hypothetical protein
LGRSEYGNQDELEAVLLDRSKYEAALKEGKILHAALWKTDNTWVKVALSKMMEGHGCGVTVEYQSISQRPLMPNLREKRAAFSEFNGTEQFHFRRKE